MTDTPTLTLVLGHAASGKSLWAEQEVLGRTGRPFYVATAELWDDGMRAKAAEHAARRGAEWSLIETPDDLAVTCSAAKAGEVFLIDCATMWLTRLTMAEVDWHSPADAWIAAMTGPASFVVVSNDVGGGVTPDNALARQFQRAQGALNQRLAAAANRVILVTAGLPQVLK